MRHNPQPQEVYRHFKGNLYQVRCLARHSETGEMMVVYQAMYGDFQIYVRELSSFMEEVDRRKYPNAGVRYRFELLNAQDENHAVERIVNTECEEVEQTKRKEMAQDIYQEAVEESVPETSYETQEELNINPLVLQFLDADSYERRLELLSRMHSNIDHDMINTMAVAIDVEIKEGEVEDRYEELKNCLLTFAKYECNRLR